MKGKGVNGLSFGIAETLVEFAFTWRNSISIFRFIVIRLMLSGL